MKLTYDYDHPRHTQVDICGHSYGGVVVTNVARVSPDRIRHLILLAPFAIGLHQMCKTTEEEVRTVTRSEEEKRGEERRREEKRGEERRREEKRREERG